MSDKILGYLQEYLYAKASICCELTLKHVSMGIKRD